MADDNRNIAVFDNRGSNDSHNGLPSYGFNKTFSRKFLNENALRSDKHGYSLTSQYLGKSQGQPNYTGANGVGNAVQQDANNTRNQIAFAQLVKVFPEDSAIRRELESDYIDEPHLAWARVKDYLQLPMEDAQVRKITKEWNELSYDQMAAEHGVTLSMPFQILTHIRKVGDYFDPEKNTEELRAKFLQCLPEQLEASADLEIGSPDLSLNFPEHYPATHVKSIVARRADPDAELPVHPKAGECDLEKLAEKLAKVWRSKHANGKVRLKEPQKVVNVNLMTDDDIPALAPYDDDEISPDEMLYFAARAPADEKTRCYWCGGLGHFSSNYDATTKQVVKCRTMIKIDTKILDKIVYPHIENVRAQPRKGKGKGKGGRGNKGKGGRGGHNINQVEQMEPKQNEEEHYDEDNDNYDEEDMRLLQHAQIDNSWSR